MQTKQSVINSNIRATVIAAFGVLSMVLPVSQSAQAQARQEFCASRIPSGRNNRCLDSEYSRCVPCCPWDPNNLNNPGPLSKGRREINWDGGNPNVLDTTAPVTPFNVFLNTRGSQFTTPGLGLSQAPPSGGPQGGWPCSLVIPPTAKPSGPSVPRGCSLLWGATLPMPRSSYRVPMALSRQQSEASARCSQMLTSRQMATQITGQHADRVPRQGQQDLIQQFRTGFAGRWKPVLLRHCVWRRAHCVGPDPVRQRCPGAERRCPP